MNRHVIARQVFEVQLRQEREAFGVQQELGRFFWTAVAPALERLFDRLAPADRLIRLDRLEIELGAVPLDRLTDEAVLRQIVAAVEEQILRAMADSGAAGTAGSTAAGHFEQWLHFLQRGSRHWSAAGRLEEFFFKNVFDTLAADGVAVERFRRLLRLSESVRDRLVLQHEPAVLATLLTLIGGRATTDLPQFARELDEATADGGRKTVDGGRVAGDGGKRHFLAIWFWKWAFEVVARREQVVEGAVLMRQFLLRMESPVVAGQLRKVFSKTVGRRRFPLLAKVYVSVSEEIKRAKADGGRQTGDGLEIGGDPAADLGGGLKKVVFQKDELVAGRQAVSGGDEDLTFSERKKNSKKTETVDDGRATVDGEEQAFFEISKKKKTPAADAATGKSDGSTAAPPLQNMGDDLPTPQATRPPTEQKTASSKTWAADSDLEKGSVWYLENAGVVLLHGYLTRFFDNLDLLAAGNRAFADHDAQETAALLLHFLATGERVAAEWDLVLSKVLCGIAVEMPVDGSRQISDEAAGEAEALLEAVIGHWSALGRTSAAGLRVNFLMRPGRLSRSDSGWKLQVERRTEDVLLDRAPFGLGVVKLPWMKELLWIEW